MQHCNAWYGLLYCVVFTSCMNCTANGTVALEHIIAPLARSIKLKVCSGWHINEDDIDEEGRAICGYLVSSSSSVSFVVAILATLFGLIFIVSQFLLCQYKKEERRASDARLKRRSLSKGTKLASFSKQKMDSSGRVASNTRNSFLTWAKSDGKESKSGV